MVKPRIIPKFDLSKALEAFSSIDEEPLTFGKHQGLTSLEVAEVDPSYLIWAYETFTLKPCSVELYELCRLNADCENKREELDGNLRFK